MKNISDMSRDEYIEHLEGTLFDLLDGRYQWHEIRNATGCSEERCKEIQEFYLQVEKKYCKKHGI